MPAKRTYADHGDACATAHAVELIGDLWAYPVLRELMLGPKRFMELQTSIRGITPAVLTSRLRHLESSGLIRKVTLPAPSRVPAYEITDWGRELDPILRSLGRWALLSPTRRDDGGLTPDAAVQSMLTMAPSGRMSPPLQLSLELHDGRVDRDPGYAYCLTWGRRLSIERGLAPRPQATVRGDSTTWCSVLYDGVPLDSADIVITGDAAVVKRLLSRFG